MYRYIIFTLLFVSPVISHSLLAQNQIKWHTWEEALEKSKKTKKKIFVDIYTEWCGWCKKMNKSTFAETDIAKYINDNYYAVKFDAERPTPIILKGNEYKFVKNGQRGYHELAVYLLQGQMSYPSMVFLDEDFSIIQAIPGFQEAPTFEMIITYFGTNSHKSVPWNKFMNNYKRDNYFGN
jgi:thioredoxin-related protein